MSNRVYVYTRSRISDAAPCRSRVRGFLSALALTLHLGACGTYVPSINEVWEPAEVDDTVVYRIKKSVFCELRQASSKVGNGRIVVKGQNVPNLPDDWGAQLTLTLQVDETGAADPSVAYNTVVNGGTFSLPLTSKLSSQATRRDVYYSYHSARSLKYPLDGGDTSCSEFNSDYSMRPLDRSGSSRLFGNLGIERWLTGALLAQNALPSSPFPKKMADKGDVLSYNVKFIVITGGTVNPTLRLMNISTGAGDPLLSANRTRTHELLLTFGPSEDIKGKRAPSQAAQGVHLSGEIYSAVASGVRSARQ